MMTDANSLKIDDMLANIREHKGVIGHALISNEGDIIRSDLGRKIDQEVVAAMSAAITSAAETELDELRQGNLKEIIISCAQSNIISRHMGAQSILIVITDSGSDLGAILRKMDEISAGF